MGRSSLTIGVDGLKGAVMAHLEEYVSMAAEETKEAVEEVSKEVKAEIQKNAPVKTGKYKKSWKVTKISETGRSLVNVVHSSKYYMLTHLLEEGHAKRGGGRTRAFPHISKGEELAERKLVEIVERKLQE